MIGTLAQLITLVAYGNNYLKNGVVPENFDAHNTTFQFCNSIDFRVFTKFFFFSKPAEKIVAPTSAAWFKYLKQDGCKVLRIYFENSVDQVTTRDKDYKLAGFVGGGGSWLIEAVYDSYSNYWASKWEVTNKNAADQKIWTVNYGIAIKNQHVGNLQIEPETAKEKLRQTLTEIAEFAVVHDFAHWANQFEKSIILLDSQAPDKEYYHTDLIPENSYSLADRQLLFAAGNAWVFGGMGTWNDLWFKYSDISIRT